MESSNNIYTSTETPNSHAKEDTMPTDAPEYHNDTPAHLDQKGTNWVGIALIIVGALFLFNSINIGKFFWQLSPLILVALGVYQMRQTEDAEQERNARRLIFIGAIIFIFTSGLVGLVGALLPVAMIAFGIYMLNRRYFDEGHWRNNRLVERIADGAKNIWERVVRLPRRGRHLNANASSANTYAATPNPSTEWVVFGSSHKRITDISHNVQTRSIFGEMEIDLRPLAEKITEGDVHVNTHTVFAETRVIIPSSWQVNVNNSAILGEVSNRSNGNTDGTVTLHIHGSTIFGETRITN